MQNNFVAIVGCGVAGISASIELLKQGVPHTIFEAKNFIGGRFYSFIDTELGVEIDNGQHLFASAYENFYSLLEFLGTKRHIESSSKIEVTFFDRKKGEIGLEEKIFSNKFGFLLGLISLKSIPLLSRLRLLNFLSKLSTRTIRLDENLSTKEFLYQYKQDLPTIDKFWKPIAVSIFNNSIERIPANLFVRTIKLAFLGKNETQGFAFSSVPQSSLLAPFVKILDSKNVEIHLGNSVSKINKLQNKFEIETKSREKFYFDNVILCVPPNVLKKILPVDWLKMQYFHFLDRINFNPILSIYVTTDEEITTRTYGYLLDSPFHWIFNKTKMLQLKYPPFLYSFTTSNAEELVENSQNQIIEMLENEIFDFFRKKVKIINFRVIKDKFATINLDREFNKIRPEQKTPFDGLFIAGDWTQTELPATLESAALSGKLAVSKMFNKGGTL